jgi:hypothetical protein
MWLVPALAVTAATLAAPAASAALAPLTGVSRTLNAGAVTVKWTKLLARGFTYTVTSTPPGKGCVVVDATACRIVVEDSTPYQFSVTATNGTDTTAPSALTAPYRTRTVLIVAGQSNAQGLNSFVVDPVTKVNYFAAPYTNGADTHDQIAWRQSPIKRQQPIPVGLDSAQLTAANILGTSYVSIFGSEIGLARQVWADRGRPVTVGKFTFSATTLAVDWNPATVGDDYAVTITGVRSLLLHDAGLGQLDVIGGFYWYQGESDAVVSQDYTAYQANLHGFITSVRAALPMNAAAPFVIAKESIAAWITSQQQTGQCPADNCASYVAGDDAVRAADDWAVANLANVKEVDTLGVARISDELHVSNVGELQLGEELAKASDGQFP